MTANIANTASSDLTNIVADYSVSQKTTDPVTTGTEETTYVNSNWSKQYGYFTQVPDLKAALLLKAVWLVGKGYDCDTETKIVLDHVSGFGKDSFKSILFNAIVTSMIGGDSFVEIIRDDKGEDEIGTLLNLKPLDPSSIRIECDKKGVIKRYVQVSKIDKSEKIFKPQDILHICHNRIADSIHGLSDIDSCEKTILAEEESFDDAKRLMHWQARPLIFFKLKTDNAAKISAFVTKMDTALAKGENIYCPDDENILSWEVIQVNPNQAIFQWRNDIRNRFYRNIGLPQIVPGAGGNSTESESKVIYYAFENIVAKEQNDIEEMIWNQLYLKIKLIPPPSLMPNLQADQGKDGSMAEMNVQPGEMQPGQV